MEQTFRLMKTLLLAIILLVIVSSCTENMSGKRTSKVIENSVYGIEEFTWKGHDYLKYYTQGGIIHSESCKCKEAKK